MNRPVNITHVDDLEWQHSAAGSRFESERKPLAGRVPGRRLGCSLYRVPPGKTAFPAHHHFSNDEAIFIISGQGNLRWGEEQYPVGEGDYIALPAGSGKAHQLLNTSQESLQYLCLSTMTEPEVVQYPDSNKVGVMGGRAPGGPTREGGIFKLFKADSDVGYYDGEE